MPKKSSPLNPFVGGWNIISVSAWADDSLNVEVQAFIEFDKKGGGSFHFCNVQALMDCRLTTRGGEPAIEWSWDGNDEMDAAQGRGWATMKGKELHGMIFFHQGDDSDFVARKSKKKLRK